MLAQASCFLMTGFLRAKGILSPAADDHHIRNVEPTQAVNQDDGNEDETGNPGRKETLTNNRKATAFVLGRQLSHICITRYKHRRTVLPNYLLWLATNSKLF
jgi:hypothetical protein